MSKYRSEACFSNVPVSFRARKAVLFLLHGFAFKIKVSIVLKNDTIKLRVSEEILTSL